MGELGGYFEDLKKRVEVAYGVASKARGKGFDVSSEVECPLALNMAEKVVNLVKSVYRGLSVSKVSGRILELEEKYGKLDSTVAFVIAREISEGLFGDFGGEVENIDCGVRVGFAYLTLGVVASPIEGYTGLRVYGFDKNGVKLKKGYFVVNFSGPIRSAGTTSVCLFLMLVDYLRELFGYDLYDASEVEVLRYVCEIRDYHERVTNLAYFPTEEEVVFLASRLPVQIDGDATEALEVSGFRDLERVNGNKIRGGMCLAFGEALALKAGKALGRLKGVKENGVLCSGWDFLEEYEVLHKKRESGKGDVEASYIKDLVAGRPVYGHPGASGSFRFRYGRGRTSGFSGVSVHPATMGVSGGFLSHGTQLRLEKPSKACIVTSCDSIEGPIVRLKGGSVRKLYDYKEALKFYNSGEIEEIIYLGDILFPIGDVIDRNADLIRPGFVEEWWEAKVESVGCRLEDINGVKKDGFEGEDFSHKTKGSSTHASLLVSREVLDNKEKDKESEGEGLSVCLLDGCLDSGCLGGKPKISFDLAVEISKKFKVALHPDFIFYWTQVSKEEFVCLMRWLNGAVWRGDKLVFNWERGVRERFALGKRALEVLGVCHEVVLDNVVVERDARALLFNLGKEEVYNGEVLSFKVSEVFEGDVLEFVNGVCSVEILDKWGSGIGARMGRPEKAKLRSLVGSPNVLFPVGDSGGRMKSVGEALSKGFVKSDFSMFRCECGAEGVDEKCLVCGKKGRRVGFCRKCGEVKEKVCRLHESDFVWSWNRKVDIKDYYDFAVKKLGFEDFEVPGLVKGVGRLTSEGRVVESLAKGILRAKFNLSVNKDGTVRYDVTEIPLTHFRPFEIGVSFERLRELGYLKDIEGLDLVSDCQVLELMPHDIVLPDCLVLGEERASRVFSRIAGFVDLELERFYEMERFYDLKGRDDLVGVEVVLIAPHNCAGVVGRVIGFGDMQGVLASPFMHAAMRRDCDGDECSVMLLMDVLLNFSVGFLPGHRGGRQDAPLVLNARIRAGETDDQILFFESCGKYPLELYEAASKGEHSSVLRGKVNIFPEKTKGPLAHASLLVSSGKLKKDDDSWGVGEGDNKIMEGCNGVPDKIMGSSTRTISFGKLNKKDEKNIRRLGVELIGDKLKRGESGFVGNLFTHDTRDFNFGNNNSVYKSLPSMKEKVDAQMALACRLRGVDQDDVARLVLERHFIRDIRGNLRKFCRQGFRCSSCNEKFRRVPLSGGCFRCSGKVIFSVSEGSVRKYMEPAMELVRDYKVSSYTRENIELIGDYVSRIFGKGEEQSTL